MEVWWEVAPQTVFITIIPALVILLHDHVTSHHSILPRMGDIASKTAVLCHALNCKLQCVKRTPSPPEVYTNSKNNPELIPINIVSKQELFETSDFIICTLPGGDLTYHFCDEASLNSMKLDAVLISMGRGTCVDEEALIKILEKKRIAGAVMDVFKTEPLPQESPLWTLDNVLLSPHNADLVENIVGDGLQVFGERLNEYMQGQPFKSIVDKQAGY